VKQIIKKSVTSTLTPQPHSRYGLHLYTGC